MGCAQPFLMANRVNLFYEGCHRQFTVYHSTNTLPSVRLNHHGALRDLETCLSPRMSTRALLPPFSPEILTFVLALILNFPRSLGFSTTASQYESLFSATIYTDKVPDKLGNI